MAWTDNLIAAYTFENPSNLGLASFGSDNLTNDNSVPQVAGKVGMAAGFNGSNQDLSIASTADFLFNGTSWTITAWANQSVAAAGGFFPVIAGKWGGSVGLEYLLYIDETNNWWIGSASPDGSATTTVHWTAGITLNTWYFLELFFDFPGTTLGLRVNNGTAVTASLTNTFNGGNHFKIGADDFGASFFQGSIDAVNVWKRLLTSGERASLYNSGNGLQYPFPSNTRRRVSAVSF